MEAGDNNSLQTEETDAAVFPECFEVCSPLSQKAAGLGMIFLLSAFILGLGFCLYLLISAFPITLYSFMHLNLDVFGFLSGFSLLLIHALIAAELIVKLYRFNLGRKIVVEKDRLTVGGRSWDALDLIECADIITFYNSPTSLEKKEYHEYAVFDKSGKKIAYFDQSYRNSEQLKRWLREGGCKLTPRNGRVSFYYLRNCLLS